MIDEEEVDDYPPPVHDAAGLHVMRVQCSTCIFRPGNPMHLNPGRVAGMTRATDRDDTNVICHQTLEQAVGAFCRGSVDRRPGQMVRIAGRLGAIVEEDPK